MDKKKRKHWDGKRECFIGFECIKSYIEAFDLIAYIDVVFASWNPRGEQTWKKKSRTCAAWQWHLWFSLGQGQRLEKIDGPTLWFHRKQRRSDQTHDPVLTASRWKANRHGEETLAWIIAIWLKQIGSSWMRGWKKLSKTEHWPAEGWGWGFWRTESCQFAASYSLFPL